MPTGTAKVKGILLITDTRVCGSVFMKQNKPVRLAAARGFDRAKGEVSKAEAIPRRVHRRGGSGGRAPPILLLKKMQTELKTVTKSSEA
ncbi:MAG: hypothetical protein CTY10_01235 [Methylotenera sp.]|nr:MAG: hypothetical protein CTY10_01235 [Methylotenera sp.]